MTAGMTELDTEFLLSKLFVYRMGLATLENASRLETDATLSYAGQILALLCCILYTRLSIYPM